MKRLLLVLLPLAIIGLDALVKWGVQAHLPLASASFGYPYGGIGLMERFLGVQGSIIHTTNSGAIWGLFSSWPIALLIVRLGFVGALVGYLMVKPLPLIAQIPLVMIVAGALGNVLDIFFYGHVIDMFYFVLWGWHYPVFNVADIAIFLGIGTLVVLSVFKRKAPHASVE
ncbi:MAG: signal peptidase II [Parachlamydiales bacterium]